MLITVLRRFLAHHRGPLVAVVALQAGTAITALYLPHLNADILNKGVRTGDTGYIWRHGVWMLVVAVVSLACAAGAVYIGSRIAAGFGRDVRSALFHRVTEFSAREVTELGAASLITRVTNDVAQVQILVQMTCTMLLSAPLMVIGGVFMAMRQDVGLSVVVAVAIPLLLVIVVNVIGRMIPTFRLMQDKVDDMNRVVREQITGLRVVRAFVREPFEEERFATANGAVTQLALRGGRLQSLMFPSGILIVNLASVAVVWFGADRIENGDLTIGGLVAYLSYLMSILMSTLMATFIGALWPRAAVSAERVLEVLNTESSVRSPVVGAAATNHDGRPGTPASADTGTSAGTSATGATGTSAGAGGGTGTGTSAGTSASTATGTGTSASAVIELDEVTFGYPGAEHAVVERVSMRCDRGETVAIVGSTGSGKTTLINLASRLFDVTGGAVRLHGVDVRDLQLEAVSSAIGLVPQRPYLFSGTVASNLRFGKPDATDDELWAALDIAQATDFVRAMPNGLDSTIEQGGTNVSGGQRQRLAIARALVRRPSLYLFDDSFSALDVATDSRLRTALKPHTMDAAVIVVAQRVSSIVGADRILVLDGGEVVGYGSHHDLLGSCATYTEIVQSQLSLDELAAAGGAS